MRLKAKQLPQSGADRDLAVPGRRQFDGRYRNMGAHQSVDITGLAIEYDQLGISRKPLSYKRPREEMAKIGARRSQPNKARNGESPSPQDRSRNRPGQPYPKAASTLAISPRAGRDILNISIKQTHIFKQESISKSPLSPPIRERLWTATMLPECTDETLDNENRASARPMDHEGYRYS